MRDETTIQFDLPFIHKQSHPHLNLNKAKWETIANYPEPRAGSDYIYLSQRKLHDDDDDTLQIERL